MTYGSLQSSLVDRDHQLAIGEVRTPALAEIDSDLTNGEASNIPICRVVTRKSGSETTQVSLGGSANVLGVTTRSGSTPQGSTTNAAEFEPNRPVNVLRRGIMAVAVAGSGTAGSRLVHYNTTTGVIDLGTPESGEKALYGVTLENTVTSGDKPALLRFVDPTEDPGFVFDVTVNGSSVVTDGTAAIAAVTGITVNGGTARVGAIDFTDADDSIALSNTDAQVIDIAVAVADTGT